MHLHTQYRNKAIVNGLAQRAHNITVISPFSEVDPPSNVHYILLENQFEIVRAAMAMMEAPDAPNFLSHTRFLAQKTFYDFCSGKYLYII